MSDAGGQITHMGVFYQDKIAALHLEHMLFPGDADRNESRINRPAVVSVGCLGRKA